MINRYSRKKIKKIWSTENKFSLWLEIECLVAEKLSSSLERTNNQVLKLTTVFSLILDN